VQGAPDDSAFPNPPYTTLATTPVSREKPFLYVDDNGAWNVRVPSVQHNSSGVTWASGSTPGKSLPISSFYVAKPSDPDWLIEANLLLGKNLLLTPGVYSIAHSLDVLWPHQVVLGIGQATLTSVNGATPIKVGNAPGVTVAGVTFDAGTKASQNLLQVGVKGVPSLGSAADPTLLADVYFRVGGPHIGKLTGAALEVNADNVIIDHTWVWRADHGIEGFTGGDPQGDAQRWVTNTAPYGAIVNGNNVTATGLFVEHFQKFNTTWNGNGGTTIFYQNELPYDPPTQADWMNGSEQGYPGYKVGDKVKTHNLYGAGVYVFNQLNPSIHTANGFEAPTRTGVKLHHIMTVNLSAGTIDHVVDGTGGAATTAAIGVPVYVNDYPAP
jgi:hypothetical protein